MSEHDSEYQDLLAKVLKRDRDSITAHWQLGRLFAKYGEPVTAIAEAIDRGVTFVSDHLRIFEVIPTAADLDRVLTERDDITSWTILRDWVKAGGPGQDSEDDPDAADISRQRRGGRNGGGEQGGLQLTVPAHIVKGLADSGANPREAMNRFWRNVTPNHILEVAYPDHRPRAFVSALDPQFQEPVAV